MLITLTIALMIAIQEVIAAQGLLIALMMLMMIIKSGKELVNGGRDIEAPCQGASIELGQRQQQHQQARGINNLIINAAINI
jgi:hypothetical protein